MTPGQIIFEKEAINTLDAKGEVLLTILSSLAQDESRSISENSTWGIRRRFEVGQHKMSTRRFLGYDTDEDGTLIINRKQAKIVGRLFEEYLSGKTVDYIKRIFEREGIQTIEWQYEVAGNNPTKHVGEWKCYRWHNLINFKKMI